MRPHVKILKSAPSFIPTYMNGLVNRWTFNLVLSCFHLFLITWKYTSIVLFNELLNYNMAEKCNKKLIPEMLGNFTNTHSRIQY